MRTTTLTALWVTRITGVIQIVLGVLFWTGNALSLIQVHILSGVVLVIGLWVLAFFAIQTGGNSRQGFVSIVWGLIVIALGLTQQQILPGGAHWIVQVIHLLFGLGAIGQAEGLHARLAQSR